MYWLLAPASEDGEMNQPAGECGRKEAHDAS
jgi:hypothetical protein